MVRDQHRTAGKGLDFSRTNARAGVLGRFKIIQVC